MEPVKIAEDIYWVGVVDWNIRDFHGYSTYLGTTYNAYLVLDDKITLIDTVKSNFADELLSNISRIIDPKRIDIVISNHTEMDHSGGLLRVMHRIGEEKPIYCSKMGYKHLPMHFRKDLNYQVVKDGEQLSIGKRTFTFLETRMLHWPDSMFTYLGEEKILFSSDAFGQHYGGSERFDDEVGDDIMPHAKKYFANILLLYSPLILKLIKRVQEMGLSFNMICPDHGIIWRKDPMKIINAYATWSEQRPTRKALVVYDTMWHSTQLMAEAICDGLVQEGVKTFCMDLRAWHRSDIITELLDAGALIVGSPTLNNGLFPTVSDFLTYMKGLKPKNKIGAAFGSYGWSGEAVKLINQELESAKIRLIHEGIRVQFVPDEDALKRCIELGKRIAKELPEQ